MKKAEYQKCIPLFARELRLSEKSQRTITKYVCDVQKFVNFIPDNEEITKEHVLAYKEKLCSGEYKSNSINTYLVILNRFHRWAQVPGLSVKEIKTQQKSSISDVVSSSDAKRLLRYAKKRKRDDIYLIMKIISTTGIRISELEYFTVENIQKHHFKAFNKGKEREIILTQELARELRKYCRDQKITEGKIFTLSIPTIWRQMKNTASEAKVALEKVHPHSFRHLFAKEFMEQYNNVLDLADILGHSSLETTRIYTRSSLDEKRKKLENMKPRRK
ncbi:MAG: tyrosine-type recombinase/integrase [Erysipelotrichaceae bacterium]